MGFTIPTIRELLSASKGKEVGLYQIMGAVKTTRTGTSDFGPWVAFKGFVEASNIQTGEVFLSGECLIPGGVTDVLEAQLIANKKSDPDAQVHFAFEIAVIATDVGGNPEAVKRDVTGKLIPVHDPSAMARAILELIGDKELIERMGQAGRRRVQEIFTIEENVRLTEEIYGQVLSGNTNNSQCANF